MTGGKGGDVGVHDFRYIATRRPKKHKSPDNNIEQKFSASSTAGLHSKHGDQNRNGMLWYIPKAHSGKFLVWPVWPITAKHDTLICFKILFVGSVTRIAAIPNTSFFLTGSKDGDVKLWDAKRAKLVYHWPKMHERHTFIQPSSRGFGGVVRVWHFYPFGLIYFLVNNMMRYTLEFWIKFETLQAAVTDIQVVSNGFLSCGGDGSVKLVQLRDILWPTIGIVSN